MGWITKEELDGHEAEATKFLALVEVVGPEGQDLHFKFMLRLIAQARAALGLREALRGYCLEEGCQHNDIARAALAEAEKEMGDT